ncbi:MAG: exodeoxyribonuclease III [Phototrophicaceae bacterium]
MKLYSWNVNGIRAGEKKGFVDWLQETKPDILGVQETKARPEQLSDNLLKPEGYHTYWASAEKKGYSGVGLYSRTEPKNVQLGLDIPEFDAEGRTIIAEYDDFMFVTTYVPSASKGKDFVPFKLEYCQALLDKCNEWQAEGKGVVVCGDINISHQEIDLARPKTNHKTTGFMPEERAFLDKWFNEEGYIDTFRHFYPDKEDMYSWWSMRSGARPRNVGWRLDYFITSPNMLDSLAEATIHTDVMGSDHCPVSLTLK